MMPIENIQEFRSVGAWKASFCALFACRLTKWLKWPDQGTNGRTRDLQTERSFSMMKHFRHSSEAVGLSQDSKMLQQFTGQISAHYCSSKVKKNTHLRPLRPDQGPCTYLILHSFMIHSNK